MIPERFGGIVSRKVSAISERMHSLEINGEGELRRQLAKPGSPGKWPLKRCVCVCASYL